MAMPSVLDVMKISGDTKPKKRLKPGIDTLKKMKTTVVEKMSRSGDSIRNKLYGKKK